jgi:mono/diheme cytochrome c family protein
MIDPTKPDLGESVNVTETHERVIRGAAATAREMKLKENGAEPVSLWVMMLCAVPLLAAGWTLGNAGTLFAYNDTLKDGYVRVIPSDGKGEALPPKPILDAFATKGSKIYAAKCSGCHGPSGTGDGAAYPSLAGSEWVTGESEVLAMVVLNGLTGPTSTGKTYGVMPSQAQGLKDEDLAHLMTYVRNSFGNKTGDVITKEMAAAAFEISGKRATPGAPVTAGELDADHKKALPGDPVDPKTMVDPVTLEPAEAK